MKEILYIQAGELANYIGTHFWNTQESYFTYGDEEESIVAHDRSFREGLNPKGEELFVQDYFYLIERCGIGPASISFVSKWADPANFGALSGLSGLYEDDDAANSITSQWNGEVVEYRQDAVPKSAYQTKLEEGDEDPTPTDPALPEESSPAAQPIRYWSDYNRVYYVPRTFQRLPDVADWETLEGDWNASKATFSRFDQDSDLTDDSLRSFMEECDLLQGIQVMHDVPIYGGFIDSFIAAFRDDFPKLTSLTFPLVSEWAPGHKSMDVDDAGAMRKAVNDALCLRNLSELSTLTVPIQAPRNWADGEWCDALAFDKRSPYHASAILSAHLESATLPLRLKSTNEDLTTLCAQLNWRGNTRTGNLCGVLPADPLALDAIDSRLYDFSAMTPGKSDAKPFARADVTRGLTPPDLKVYEDWTSRAVLPDSLLKSVHGPAYPLPTSFPQIFNSHPTGHARLRTTSLLTTLTTTPSTASLFRGYATLVRDLCRRRADVGTFVGVERDEMRELEEDMWALCDGYDDDENHYLEDEGRGEDEE